MMRHMCSVLLSDITTEESSSIPMTELASLMSQVMSLALTAPHPAAPARDSKDDDTDCHTLVEHPQQGTVVTEWQDASAGGLLRVDTASVFLAQSSLLSRWTPRYL